MRIYFLYSRNSIQEKLASREKHLVSWLSELHNVLLILKPNLPMSCISINLCLLENVYCQNKMQKKALSIVQIQIKIRCVKLQFLVQSFSHTLYQENFKYSCLNTFLSWWNYSQLRFNWTKNTHCSWMVELSLENSNLKTYHRKHYQLRNG